MLTISLIEKTTIELLRGLSSKKSTNKKSKTVSGCKIEKNDSIMKAERVPISP
jgi:hypothetical protein